MTKQSRDCAGASDGTPQAGAGELRLGGTTVGPAVCARRRWKTRQKDGGSMLGWGGEDRSGDWGRRAIPAGS